MYPMLNSNVNKKTQTAVLVGKTQSNKSQPRAEQTTRSTAKLIYYIYKLFFK